MFFNDFMNDSNKKQENSKSFPMPPFPPLPMPFMDKDFSMDSLPKETVKKITQELISIDATPEELEKLQNTLDNLYGVYVNNKSKQPRK